MDVATLHEAIAKVCPIISVGTGDPDDRATWVFTPADGATQPQLDAAASVIATIDPAAKLDAVVHEEAIRADPERASFVDKLKTASPAQIENEVRTMVDANAVTNLATAQACLKRVETALVRLAKAVALSVR